jgi:predicted nucleotidyltransferase
MRIDHEEVIAGLPALIVRSFMRSFENEVSFEWAQETLELSKRKTRTVLNTLREEGFLEVAEVRGKEYFRKTIKGNALAMASTRKPISREKALELLREFMDRCVAVRSEEKYLYYPSKILLFGSLATGAASVNDIDIVLELSPKNEDKDKHMAACAVLADAAERNGKRFRGIIERLFWAQIVTQKFLGGTSRRLSFHTQSDLNAINTATIDLLHTDA